MAQRSPIPMQPSTVLSDGVRLAAFHGPPSGPPIVFVHGYPDTHALWDSVIARLADRFYCISYDVRGAGASDVPPQQSDYRLSHLRGDLAAVIDALSPDRPVHLVAHDWGSLQAWDAIAREESDPRLTGRLASLTTISGPCLEHVTAFRRDAIRADWSRGPGGGLERKRAALRQGVHSWYVYAFHLPKLPEWTLRRLNSRRPSASGGFAATLADDSVNGLNLYRANIFHREPMPSRGRTTLPVQLVVATRDKYVTPAMLANVGDFAPNLTRVEIEASHWVPRTRPHELAPRIAAFVDAQELP